MAGRHLTASAHVGCRSHTPHLQAVTQIVACCGHLGLSPSVPLVLVFEPSILESGQRVCLTHWLLFGQLSDVGVVLEL